MPTILDNLHRDHINMTEVTAIVHRELSVIESGETPDLDMLEDIMRYVTGYPDTHHHPTEDIVFERLKRNAPHSAELVDAILDEHDHVIESGTRFLDAVQAVRDEAIMTRDAFVSAGRDYLSLLERHMDIEESRLFPLANRELSSTDWQELAAVIEHRPDPLFGAALDEDYRRLRLRIESHRSDERNAAD